MTPSEHEAQQTCDLSPAQRDASHPTRPRKVVGSGNHRLFVAFSGVAAALTGGATLLTPIFGADDPVPTDDEPLASNTEEEPASNKGGRPDSPGKSGDARGRN